MELAGTTRWINNPRSRMELSNHHLSLKLSRLKGTEEMEFSGHGFCFMILKGGTGACRCGLSSHRLGSGDVLVVDRASRSKIQVQNNGEMVFWSFVAEFEQPFPLFSCPEVCILHT